MPADDPAGSWRRFVMDLGIMPAMFLSAGDRRRVVDHVVTATTEELVEVPTSWPVRVTPPLAAPA